MAEGFPAPALTGASVDMVVDPFLQTSLVVSQALIALVVLYLVVRRSDPAHLGVNLMLLAAGAATALMESMADALLLIWHPVIGQWTLYTAYGHSVPVWVPLCFFWAFGGQAVWFASALREGAPAAKLWRLFLIFGCTDILFEVPPIWLGILEYYGDQPLVFAPYMPLPFYLPFGNALTACAAGTIAVVAERHFNGARNFWIVAPLALGATFSAMVWHGWPVSLALNADVPTSVRWAAGLLSIGLSALAMSLLIEAMRPSAQGAIKSG